MEKCEFCSLTELDKKYLLYENKFWYLFLADRQDYLGRCILVCKRHCAGIAELSEDEWLSLKEVMTGAENLLKSVLKADAFNWTCLMNNAYKSENPNPHIHFHLRPRYSKPVNIGGIQFVDEKFGHHYDNKLPLMGDNATQAIFEMLVANIGGHF